MSGSILTSRRTRILFAGIAGASAIMALATPARALWIGFPFPFPGYYPPPYYPLPYYYAPPAAYYPPPAYPADPPYTAPAQPAPSIYSQPTQPSSYTPEPLPPLTPAPSISATPGAAAQITYTNKPAFRNASGQTCREFTTAGAGGKPVYGTACQAADGQWRVAD